MKKDIQVINNRISFEIGELSEAGRRSLTSIPVNRNEKLSISPKAKRNIKTNKTDLIKKFHIITD